MAKQSLVSQSIPTTLAVSIPDVQETFERTPYVAFCSVKSPKFPQWYSKIPSLQDGDPVLFERDSLTALNPFRFFLLAVKQWWGSTTEQGEVLEATFDPEKAREDKKRFKEHGESVVLVSLPTRVQVARVSFKTAKCGALKSAINGFKDASADEWGSKSAEHKQSLSAPDARFRYTTLVSLRGRTAKTGQGAGFNYVQASGTVHPITVPEMTFITEFFGDKENHKLCDEVIAKHNERVKAIGAKIV